MSRKIQRKGEMTSKEGKKLVQDRNIVDVKENGRRKELNSNVQNGSNTILWVGVKGEQRKCRSKRSSRNRRRRKGHNE
jgi:hypothetical protein